MVLAGSDPNGAPRRLRRLAAEVFILGFPLVLMDAVRRAHPLAPNQFFQLADRCETLAPGLLREDARTLRASAWIDLSQGPVILTLPDMRGRHCVLSLVDAWGDTFATFGSRTHFDAGHDIALVGPDWRGELAPGLIARRARTNLVWALSRVVAHSPGDRDMAHALLHRHYVMPLGGGGGVTIPLGRAVIDPPATPLVDLVAGMDAATFFPRLEALLRSHPLQDADHRRIRAFEQFDLDAAIAAGRGDHGAGLAEAADKGLRDGRAMIRGAAAIKTSTPSGWWRAAGRTPDADPLARAAAAYFSLAVLECADLLTLTNDCDAEGGQLHGANRYRLRFSRENLPPAKAFWSLALGSPPNPDHLALRRYALSDRDGAIFNRDGSLDVFIQHDAPSAGRAANWLPVPDAPFSLAMRLHWPLAPALTGQWPMPMVEPVNADRQRQRRPVPERGAVSRSLWSGA